MQRLYRDMSAFPQTATELAQALQHARGRTLALMDAWCEALPSLKVPQESTLNPPLWEWGHIGWFQTWWIGRNRQRSLGLRCDPDHARLPSAVQGDDERFNSSTVAHVRRWSLELPGVVQTKAELARGLEETLLLLDQAGRSGQDLYFWQLVLVHEDMHHEAALYMAQALGLPMPASSVPGSHAAGKAVRPATPPTGQHLHGWRRLGRRVRARRMVMGQDDSGRRFRFDNESEAHEVSLPDFEIDLQPVTWGEYLDFVEATNRARPSAVRREAGQWWFRRFGSWQELDLHAPACYLSAADAQAWCDWSARELPTEAQWECAARSLSDFEWGQVWEWTASAFEPYPGFVPHPYRDYSAPWFGTHRVLRGASEFTSARLVSTAYRNFFLPERQDVMAGFRTVARSQAG